MQQRCNEDILVVGDLPKKRVQRKCEQLENLVAAVRLIAHPGDTIVDFCAGGVNSLDIHMAD